jgi:hypothetical protein
MAVAIGIGALGGLALWAVPNVIVRSYAAGLLTATVLGILMYQVTQMAGTGAIAMGEIAEQWTAQELRKLRRKGWRVVNHFMLRAWDIDHVLVGPGGVFAIETKWSAQPWELNPMDRRISSAIRQVSANAKDLSLWQPLKAAGGVAAQGVVILWGGRVDGPEGRGPLRLHDVEILTGRTIEQWRESLPSDKLNDTQVEDCWRALEAQVRVRDRLGGLPPDSVWTLSIRYLTAFAAALISFVVTADLLTLVDSYAWWPVVYGATLTAGLAGRRVSVLRPYASGWLAGVGATFVAAVAIIMSRVA